MIGAMAAPWLEAGGLSEFHLTQPTVDGLGCCVDQNEVGIKGILTRGKAKLRTASKKRTTIESFLQASVMAVGSSGGSSVVCHSKAIAARPPQPP
jgi:hypothetical protein